MSRVTTKFLLGGLAALAVAGAASAAPASEPTLVVRYDTAALETDVGARHVYAQIARAAERVCPNVSYSLLVSSAVLKCREEAISGAVGKIHNQRLAAIHASKSNMKSG
jgi:UrcA family protein